MASLSQTLFSPKTNIPTKPTHRRRVHPRIAASVSASLSVETKKRSEPGSLVKSVKARQIVDSRGNPTVEVDLVTGADALYRSAVPSGASTGIYEALELRDGDKNVYGGKGVLRAVANINDILAPKLLEADVRWNPIKIGPF